MSFPTNHVPTSDLSRRNYEFFGPQACPVKNRALFISWLGPQA